MGSGSSMTVQGRAGFALLLGLLTASSPLFSSAGNTMTPKWDDLIPGSTIPDVRAKGHNQLLKSTLAWDEDLQAAASFKDLDSQVDLADTEILAGAADGSSGSSAAAS